MSDRLALEIQDRIFAELQDLRDSLSLLTRRVDRLAGVIENRTVSAATSGLGSASLVSASSISSVGYIPQYPETSVLSGSVAESEVVTGWTEREEVAQSVGLWLRRALEGGHRGNSGRHRIPESSNLYIVCRDFEGRVFEEPAKVLTSFSEVKKLCCRRGEWGSSVFVGLPSAREVEIALGAGRFGSPLNN